jgi:hypothetical protein
MLDVERDAGRGTSTLALGVVPHHVHAVWIVVSEVQHAPTAPASCRPGVGAIFGGCYGDGAFRVQLVHLSPNFVNVRQKDSPALTCSAASRRRTAPLMWCRGRQ